MNAVKHADPEHIEVVLFQRGSVVSLLIRDDGRGISAGKRTRGLGLRILRDRADLIGAGIEITSRKVGGTMVKCRLWLIPSEA